ncbi:MAG: HEAT repeat domain-containing protein [Treponema sp.]|nr:HEAT repeat domain-containing protein [Treponema sp.]
MKKIIFATTAIFLTSLLSAQEEPTAVKDLYPMDSVTVSDDAVQAVEDKLSDILGDLDLTDEEKKLLEAPDSPDIDDVSEAGTDEVESPASDSTPEEEAQPAPESPSDEDEASEEEDVPAEEEFSEEPSGEKKNSLAGVAEVPKPKRPKPIDQDKAKAAADKDENPDVVEKNQNTIKFGIPSEISNLIEDLIKNDDPRFTEEIYDLFQVSQNVVIQKKILEYFTKLEDPCLEDFAVTVLNDPYDTKPDVVKACFEYIQKVHTEPAIPAVFTILESENETYFNDTLATIGEIGGPDAAVSVAEYLERDDLSDAQRQTLMKTLGKLHAVETFDKIVAILENEDENSFVRMYAAEALGLMGKLEAIPVLTNAFKDANPNLRQYAIKGLSEFAQNEDAQAVVLQGIRDEHWKVRQESIKASEKILDRHAIPYLEYRAENDSERIIKEEAIYALSLYNDVNADNFLIDQLEKKMADSTKIKIVATLLEADHGEEQILALAEKALADVRMKNLAKGIGKELAKYSRSSFKDICLKYLDNKDADIVGLGLDMYKNYKFGGEVEEKIKALYDSRQTNSTNRNRAKRLLGIED